MGYRIDELGLEVGDRVTYEYNGEKYTDIVNSSLWILHSGAVILKKERPTYEVVAEVNKEEEKEKLLTEDEREGLKSVINNINNFGFGKVDSIIVKKSPKFTNIFFYSDGMHLGSLAFNFMFDSLMDASSYTLEDLGLEE